MTLRMASGHRYSEIHRSQRVSWLRAAVLGANDGIISVASLMVGVAGAHGDHHQILLTGSAGLVAGAMSMAAGEYVSVSSQRDAELADLKRERHELETDVEAEREELANIYVARGVTRELARQVALQLMAYDAIGAHARDELGISSATAAQPVQAAVASAGSFALGAILPLSMALVVPSEGLLAAVALFALATLGALAARLGGARVGQSVMRVTFWGAFAMLITYLSGHLLNF